MRTERACLILGLCFALSPACGGKKPKKKDPKLEAMKASCKVITKSLDTCGDEMKRWFPSEWMAESHKRLKAQPLWKKLTRVDHIYYYGLANDAVEAHLRKHGAGLLSDLKQPCKALKEQGKVDDATARQHALIKACQEKTSACKAFWKCLAPRLFPAEVVPKVTEEKKSPIQRHIGRYKVVRDTFYPDCQEKSGKRASKRARRKKRFFELRQTKDRARIQLALQGCQGPVSLCVFHRNLRLHRGHLGEKGARFRSRPGSSLRSMSMARVNMKTGKHESCRQSRSMARLEPIKGGIRLSVFRREGTNKPGAKVDCLDPKNLQWTCSDMRVVEALYVK